MPIHVARPLCHFIDLLRLLWNKQVKKSMRIYHLPLFSCAFINTACVCRQPILQANISVSVSHLNHDAIVEITIGISNLFNESVHTKLEGVTVLSIFDQRDSPPFAVKFAGEQADLLPLPDSRWHWHSHSPQRLPKPPVGNAPSSPGTERSHRR